MSYTLADLDIINLRNLATPNKKYVGENGRVYVGTKEGRLLLEDSASNITFNSTDGIDANNVQDAIEDLSDNADTNAQDAVGSILTDTTTIGLTYDSSTPSIYADLLNTSVTAGTYGSATQVPQFVVDSQGRLTSASNVSISLTGTFWELTGNAGTTAGTNFIGTTDNTDLVFKRNNVESGFISAFNTAFGESSLSVTSSGLGNSAYGYNSLSANTTGYANTAIGSSALASNNGVSNTAVGANCFYGNVAGSNNSVVGSGIGAIGLATGSDNTAIGTNAFTFLTTGSNNIAIGYQAASSLTTESNRVFIGNSSIALPTSGGTDQILTRDSTTGEIKYITESGIVKTSRTLTINGSAQDLSANRTWTITTAGTTNRITVTNGATLTPTIDIASTYVGQSSITTLGTITTGVWNGTPITNTYLANSTISGISLGSNLATLTIGTGLTGTSYNGSTGVTIAVDGSYVPTTATNSINVGITDDTTTNAIMYPTWVTANSGNLPIKVTSTKLNFNPSTGSLTSTGNVITPQIYGSTAANGDITIEGTSSATKTTSYVNLQPTGGNVGIGNTNPLGTLSIISANTSGTTTSSSFNLIANNLTSGYGAYISSSGTAAATNQRGLQVALSGANAASSVTSYGAVFLNSHSGTTSTNYGMLAQSSGATTSIGGYFSASGGTNNYAIIVPSGGGNVGIGTTAPTAYLHLGAGSATANTAPLKFTSGTNLTTAEAGAIEYNGSNFFATATAANRRQLVLSNVATPSNGFLPIGNGTDFTLAAITAGTGITVTNAAGSITISSDAGVLNEATLTIPSAQVLTLNSSPITIVAAPGAGKYIEIISGSVVIETYGGIPYATNTNLQLIFPGAPNAGQVAINNQILISTIAKPTMLTTNNVTSITASEISLQTNAALQVKVQTGNPTAGNSDIKVKVLYRIVTI